jgi:hypothetical protein
MYLEQSTTPLSLLGNSPRKPGLVEDTFRRYTDKINRIAQKRTNIIVTLARTLDEWMEGYKSDPEALDKTRELGEIVTDILAVKLGVSIPISCSAILYLDLTRSITLILARNISTKIS